MKMSKKRRRAYKALKRFFRRIGEGKHVTKFPKKVNKVFG